MSSSDSGRPPSRPCEVRIERRAEAPVVVVVSGDVDMNAAPLLRERLIELFTSETIGDHLVVDLADVSFIDSTGLGVLVGAHKRASAAGARITAIASPAARRAMRLTGLDKLWQVVDPPRAT